LYIPLQYDRVHNGSVVGLPGIRFTYTSHLRQDDAGILTIGAREGKSQIIPPHYSDFKSIAVGSEECLSSVKISKYSSSWRKCDVYVNLIPELSTRPANKQKWKSDKQIWWPYTILAVLLRSFSFLALYHGD
jgi:hypothetical protein